MLRGFISALTDIIYPETCAVCKKNIRGISNIDRLICLECWGRIKRNLPPFCCRCGRHLENSKFGQNICPECLKKKLYFDRAFSPCLYEGVIKQLIHEFKYRGKEYLGPTLSRLVINFIKEYNLGLRDIDFVIPVPLHKTRHREREFNQAEILSRCIAQEFNKQVLDNNLIRHKYTKAQIQLKQESRFTNVKGIFSVKEGALIKGKNILLVDDVLTTAATCSEAAQVLKNKGAKSVLVLTLAN